MILGSKHTKETIARISKSRSGKISFWEGRIRENAPRWKGGRIKVNNGYIRLLLHDENKNPYFISEHRYVMEQFLKRKLERLEEVHYINGIRDDNRIENLELVVKKKHRGEVRCPHCCKSFFIN